MVSRYLDDMIPGEALGVTLIGVSNKRAEPGPGTHHVASPNCDPLVQVSSDLSEDKFDVRIRGGGIKGNIALVIRRS